MEVSYRRDTCHTYMIIAGLARDDTEYEEKMMENQQAEVLLPFHVQYMNDQKYYYYDITGKITLREMTEKKQADEQCLHWIIRSLIETCQAADVYLLNPDSLMLDPEYLYMDMAMHLYVGYVPGWNMSLTDALERLTACLLENTDHMDKEGVLLSYNFYRSVRQSDFTPGSLAVLLSEDEKMEEEKPKMDSEKILIIENETEDLKQQKKWQIHGRYLLPVGMGVLCVMLCILYSTGLTRYLLGRWGLDLAAGAVTAVLAAVIIIFTLIIFVLWDKISAVMKRQKKGAEDVWEQFEPWSLEEQSIFTFTEGGSADKTVILSGQTGNVRLISMNKNVAGDMVLSQFPCVIGCRKPDADIVIAAAGISRRHAVLERTEEEIYLSDLQSTNGTFVNGERLKDGEKRLLMIEDIVSFGDVRFIYCGYA